MIKKDFCANTIETECKKKARQYAKFIGQNLCLV